VLHTVSAAGILFAQNLKFVYACMFFNGIALAPRVFVGYLYMQEVVPKEKQTFCGTWTFVIDGCCLGFASIYYYFILNDCWYYLKFAVALSIMVTCLSFVLDESPKYLHSRGQYDMTKKLLTSIARCNKIMGEHDTFTKKFHEENKLITGIKRSDKNIIKQAIEGNE